MNDANENAIINSLPTAHDGEFKIDYPKVGKNVYREPYWWNPIDNGSYSGNGNKQIRIDIPKEHIWDFTTAYLSADVVVTSNGIPVNANPGYIRLANGTWNMFERVRHLSNLQPIEEMYPYNLIFNFQWIFEQSQEYENLYGELFGVGTQAQRNAWATGVRRYHFPIDLGWINSGPFPAKYINPLQSIEILLADPNQCIESNYGNLGYTLSNVQLHAYKLTQKFPGVINDARGISWEEGFARLIRSGGYKVMLDYWDWYQNAPLSQQGDYLIPVKTAAIQGIYTVLGNSNNISNPLLNDRLLTYPKLNVNQYWLRVFQKLYPEQPVECRDNAIEAYQFYVNWVNCWHFSGFPSNDPSDPDPITEIPLSISEFNTDAFAMIADFRSVRKVPSINPLFNTDSSTSDIRFYLRFETGPAPNPPVGTCLYHFVRSSSIFGITPDGNVYTQLN